MSFQTCWICRRNTNCTNDNGRHICKTCEIAQTNYIDYEDSDYFPTREMGKRMRMNVEDSQLPPGIDY